MEKDKGKYMIYEENRQRQFKIQFTNDKLEALKYAKNKKAVDNNVAAILIYEGSELIYRV